MKTRTIRTYSFPELFPEAQQVAIEEYLQDPFLSELDSSEAWETAEAFNKLWGPFEIVGLDRHRQTVRIPDSDWSEWGHDAPYGLRAWKWLLQWVQLNFHGKRQYPNSEPFDVAMDWRKACAVLQDCPLTGCCYDCFVLDPIRLALEGNPDKCPDVEEVFRDCGETLALGLERETEYRYSEEAAREYLSDSDAEYLENGDRF